MVATEEALVELYAAVKTGKWEELESRYGIKIHESWRNGEKSVQPLLERVATILKRLMSRVVGRPITDEEVFTILSGIEKGIDTYAKSGRDVDGNGEVKYRLNDRQKEQRGIYNVSFNEKKSTQIKKDLDDVNEALKYEKGFENKKTKKGYGALHIQKHLDPQKNGYVTKQELLNMGDIIRGVNPVESRGKRIYEYTNNDNVRFRVVVGDRKNGENVISFFSNRRAGEENNILAYNYTNPSDENNNAQKGNSQNENLNQDEKFSTSQNNANQDVVAKAHKESNPTAKELVQNAVNKGREITSLRIDKDFINDFAKALTEENNKIIASDASTDTEKKVSKYLNQWLEKDKTMDNAYQQSYCSI